LKYVEKKYLTFLDSKTVIEHVVFHGNKNKDPNESCLTKTGLDFREQLTGQPLGHGIHFSDDTIYSHENAFENNSIRKIVMSKIIAGNIHENDAPDTELRVPPKNHNLITLIVKNTQRIYACYENFNALPWYIITYDSSKKTMPTFFEYWCWKHINGDIIPLDDDINILIDMQYRRGIEKTTEKFKFSKFGNQEMTYNIILKQNCISIENIESGEIVELEKHYLKNCKRINNLKEMFLTNLNQDIEDLNEIFSKYEFPNDGAEISVKNTLPEIERLIKNINADTILRPLDKSDQEFTVVKYFFEETMPSKEYQIIKIEKVDNKLQNLTFLI
jgi:hypothetical protein